MLQVSRLSCARGERSLFRDLDFRVNRGEWLYLRGGNGAGKTTLLRSLCGLLRPESGQILWNNEAIDTDLDAYRASLCYLGHAHGTKEELNAVENLEIAARLAGGNAKLNAREALESVGLSARNRSPLATYSQGQKRRVGLARLAMSRAKLWLLDEPLVALDQDAIAAFFQQLRSHLTGGGLAVLTSHQSMNLDLPGQELWLGAPTQSG